MLEKARDLRADYSEIKICADFTNAGFCWEVFGYCADVQKWFQEDPGLVVLKMWRYIRDKLAMRGLLMQPIDKVFWGICESSRKLWIPINAWGNSMRNFWRRLLADTARRPQIPTLELTMEGQVIIQVTWSCLVWVKRCNETIAKRKTLLRNNLYLWRDAKRG